jgi:ribosomal-protein-serine acetyltransferase
VSDLEAFVHLSLGRQAEGKGFFAAIRHSDALAGTVGLRIDPPDRAGEIGYWIDRDLQGRGLATRCVVAVLDLCFGQLGLHRVEIRCAPGNVRSRAIPERLGFAMEGTLRGAERFGEDDYRDLVVYAKLATDPRVPGGQ